MATVDLLKTQLQFIRTLEQQGKSDNTVKNYRADLHAFNKFLTERQRPLVLKNLPSAQVQEYAGHLEKTYGSPNSIRRRVQTLRMYFDFLVREHGFPTNPIKQIQAAPKVLDLPSPPPFKELVRVHNWLGERGKALPGLEGLLAKRNQLILWLVYEAGLKVSDLARLELQDLIPDKKEGMRVLVRPPKRDPYSIPVGAGLKKFFQSYMAELEASWPHQASPRFALFNANPHRILSGSLSPRGSELVFEELRRSLKLDITPRSVRQAAVFRWMTLKTEESQIREWLGVAPDYDLGLYNKVFHQGKTTPIYLDLPHA